jgi:hypothetical protein
MLTLLGLQAWQQVATRAGGFTGGCAGRRGHPHLLLVELLLLLVG